MQLFADSPDILTVAEAAQLLRVSQAAILALIQSHQLGHLEIEKKVLIPKIYLQKFIENSCRMCYNISSETVPPEKSVPAPMHLDNCKNEPDCTPFQEGEHEMATKINRTVVVNGARHWIRANTEQEYADKLAKLFNHVPAAPTAPAVPAENAKHPFSDYALNWFEIYSKPNIETVTSVTYKRQITKYLLPAFEGLNVEEITTDHVQRLFNGMNTAKATKDKVKIVLNQILDAAVEDDLLTKNPLKSSRLRITGKESKATETYSVEQMRYLIQHIDDVKQPQDRAYLAIQTLHPLRLEEVLGLKWSDVDTEKMWLHINRAVTHPTRNQPEVKKPKTNSSIRVIGLSALAAQYLVPGDASDFIFGGKVPLSYTQVRRMCDRIKADTGFSENITPIRFRTTVLTDLYDQTKDIKLAQAAAGHTTSAMTLRYYVKGRETISQATAAVENIYTV